MAVTQVLNTSDARPAACRRARRLLVGILTLGALLAPVPASASAATPPSSPAAVAVGLPPERPVVADRGVESQVPGADPAFDDTPLPTNPVSPSVSEVRVESAEVSAADDTLRDATRDRDDAIARRDDLRQEITELQGDRETAIALLAQRRVDERARGEDREASVALHGRRVDEAERALRILDRARDALRELLVANYMSESSTVSDIGTVLSGQGGVNDALVRLSLGESSVAARADDVDAALDDRRAAIDARTRAREARRQAEQAERDAVAARQGTEQQIRDIEAETARTRAEEVDSVEALGRRETAVLEAQIGLTPPRLRADVVGAGLDFQLVALDAWVKAAASAPCRVEWWMLAGISKIEGRHGTFGGGRLGARGYPTTRIIGPQLDGSGDFARIGDTDRALYDDDPVFDRAVGPMQFIPSTWARWGRDGDGDGQRDPHTFYDATAGAAAYLCAGRTDLTDETQLRAAYFSYNHSMLYVAAVLAQARSYQATLTVAPHVPALPARPFAPPA